MTEFDKLQSTPIIKEGVKRYFGESQEYLEGMAYAIHMLVEHGKIDDIKAKCECFDDEVFLAYFESLTRKRGGN